MDLRAFTPDDRADVEAFNAVRNASETHDAPWVHPRTVAGCEGLLRHGWDGEPGEPHLAVVDGEAVAAGVVHTSERDNLHLAWLELDVRPDRRRSGIGTAVLAGLEARARERGRTSAGISCWDGRGHDGFALARGFEHKSSSINRRQLFAEVDPALVHRVRTTAEATAADYELVCRRDRTPDDELESLAVMAAAINDAPKDDLDIEDEVFDADRMRAYEDAQLARGFRLYRVMARHRPTGALAGQTVVVVDAEQPGLAEQHDTSVVGAHRGHRLGALLKSGMLEWLRDAEPQVSEVDTWNAESNGFMIGVNEQLGYRVMGRALEFQKPLGPG